jgi:hypothetical protein
MTNAIGMLLFAAIAIGEVCLCLWRPSWPFKEPPDA